MSQDTPESASRTKLLDAAVEAFGVRGFHGTSTRDIAGAAGMSPAAVYVHHRSKEDLLHLISRRGHDRTLRLVQDSIASVDEPVDQLRAFMRAFAAHHARNHTTARIVNYELAALSADHLADVAAVRRAIEGEVRGLVERGVRAGVFVVDDPAITARALLSLGIDVARWFHDDGSWTPDDVGRQYADLAVRMVGAGDVGWARPTVG
jgi:AcrR family transcriptional regulator